MNSELQKAILELAAGRGRKYLLRNQTTLKGEAAMTKGEAAMTELLRDVRFAARLLWRQKGFAVTALLTLAACIGANAIVFAVVNSVVLRPLPFPYSDRLVTIFNSYPRAGVERGDNSVPDYYDRRAEADVFESVAVYDERGMTVGSEGRPERVRGFVATPSLLTMLHARPHRGRLFTEADAEPDQSRKVILSHALWQRLFAGRDDAIGRDLRVDGVPFAIVGVLPENFVFLNAEAQLWTPAAFGSRDRADDRRHSNNWEMIGRLKPGGTIAKAQARIDAINARMSERMPQFRQILKDAGYHTRVLWLQDDLVREVRDTLFLLWAGVAFVLLIGWVNLANLTLVRSTARLKEFATRHALGAGRWRLARQLLTETALLTLAGAALGLLAAYATLRSLGPAKRANLPRATEIAMDGTAALFTLLVAIVAAAAIGAIPMIAIRQSALNQTMREEGRSGTASRRARLFGRALVASQVAFAFMLLIAAGLLLASFRRVLAVDPGFNPNQILTARINLPGSRYRDDAVRRAFVAAALDRLRAVPGVRRAGATTTIPYGGSQGDSVILAEGYRMAPGESLIAPHQIVATPGYFETMQARLRRGRFFTPADHERATRVVIIDTPLARKFWPDEDPIGRRMWVPDSVEALTKGPGPNTRYLTVVGVVDHMRVGAVGDVDDQRVGAYYFAFAQSPEGFLTFAFRGDIDPSSLANALRREVAALDPELPLYDVQTLEERVASSVAGRRAAVTLAGGFGLVALLLATLGIYGVLAYQVTQRTREIGIRMALGSESGRVFRLIVGEGAALLAVGLLIGLAGLVAVRKALESELYGVSPFEPAVLASVTGVLAAVALAACLVPARRAARIDPAVALTE